MKTRILATVLAVALVAAACGSDSDADSAVEGDGDVAAEPAADAPVAVADTSLGEALVNDQGLTLYGFTNDTEGVPTCFGGCADVWPPLLVDGAELPPGLDPAVFSVSERDGGTHQLRAGVWPLYTYALDVAPGDVKGQGSDGIWFVVAPDGSLIGGGGDEAAAEPAALSRSNEGPGY